MPESSYIIFPPKLQVSKSNTLLSQKPPLFERRIVVVRLFAKVVLFAYHSSSLALGYIAPAVL